VGSAPGRIEQQETMAFISGEKLKALSERRVVERRRVNIGSWVTSLDGTMVLACQTQDASPSGVRVQPKETQTLPKTVYYLDVKDRMAYEAIVRWQEKNQAGLEFMKAYRFMDIPSPEVKKVIKDIAP
jgi:hypothetical protein